MDRSHCSSILLAIWLAGYLFLFGTQGNARAGELLEALTTHKGGHYYLMVSMLVNAPRDRIYTLLTDYDNLAQLSPDITSSRLLKLSDDGHTLVEVNSRQCVVWFCRNIHRIQEVVNQGDGSLKITDVS